MAFSGRLQLEGGETITVLNFSYSVSQSIDGNGVPRDMPVGNMMSMTIASGNETKPITEWATHPQMKKNGVVSFANLAGDGTGKQYAFTDAYCIGYSDSFGSIDEALITTITISAMSVVIDESYSVVTPGYEGSSGSGNSSSSGTGSSSSSSSSGSDAPVSSFIAD